MAKRSLILEQEGNAPDNWEPVAILRRVNGATVELDIPDDEEVGDDACDDKA